MAALKDRLRTDLTAAMKSRDEVRTRTLRSALTAVSTAEVAGATSRELSDDEVLKVLAREAKRRREAADAFDDGSNDRQTETRAPTVRLRAEERVECASQRHLVHAAPIVTHRDDDIASFGKLSVRDDLPCDVAHLGADLDAPTRRACLCGVVAQIDDHLLQLCCFSGYDRCCRCVADQQLDRIRQGRPKQCFGFGHEQTDVHRAAARFTPTSIRQQLVDEIAGALCGAANCRDVV